MARDAADAHTGDTRYRIGGLIALSRGLAERDGAGEGNRTLVVGLGSLCSTIELHPRNARYFTYIPSRVRLE
jgi:hypothetical protein